jgi:hypothetical protein
MNVIERSRPIAAITLLFAATLFTVMRQPRAVTRFCCFVGLLCLLAVSPNPARAQSAASPPRTTAQLEQLVAPIALYPDSVLSQILMASTYPLEVVEAARWLQSNPGVTGQALEDAMQKQQWDPSVKSLTAIPQTLQMMNDKLDSTQQLGDAFLAQQADVLDAVQRLRARAENNGTLKTTDQQKVTKTSVAQAPPGTSSSRAARAPAYVYTIESANPDEYYLPIYDPGVVYGAWPYADYQPFYWYPSDYYPGSAFAWGAGIFAGAAIWGGVDWWRRNVNINPLRYNQFNRTNIANNTWTHNPAHRGAVPYRDGNVAQRFGDQSKAGAREAFRGKADAGRRDIAKQGGASKAAQGKAGGSKAAEGKASGAKGADRKAGGSKAAEGKAGSKAKSGTSKQASAKGAGSKKAASTKGAGSKQAARSKQSTGAKQSARAGQSARGGQSARAGQSAAHARASVPRSPGMSRGGGGGARTSGGGGRGGGGGRDGGRRSDVMLKHDITLLGYLDNGIGFYRFSYDGSEKAYVGVIAQEVQEVMPEAVIRARDGYLIVLYDKLGLRLQTYDRWIASGARMPVVSPNRVGVSGHVFSQDWQQRATYPWSRTVPPKHDGAAPVLAHEVK